MVCGDLAVFIDTLAIFHADAANIQSLSEKKFSTRCRLHFVEDLAQRGRHGSVMQTDCGVNHTQNVACRS